METKAFVKFPVPLGSSAHQLAEYFFYQQTTPSGKTSQKARQVYLNTLAVYAVRFYLKCMEIESNWETSDSWNPVLQAGMNVADLEISGLGKLECRPVLLDAQVVQIPAEFWSDRIGYVAVQIDKAMKRATLLGFLRTITAESEEIPLTELQSLTDLRKHIAQLREAKISETRVNLSQWGQNIFEPAWVSLPEFFANQGNLVFGLRNTFNPTEGTSELSATSVKRARLINLGLQIEETFLALVVAIAPDSLQGMNILVQVRPPFGDCLPPNITLALLLESGEILRQAQSRSADNCIQIGFWGQPGERFNIKIAFSEASTMQKFVI